MSEVPWDGITQRLRAEGAPWSVEALVRRLGRRLVRTTAAATHRWVLARMALIEEYELDADKRWEFLKRTLSALGQDKKDTCTK